MCCTLKMNKKTIVVNLMFYTFGVSQSWQCQSFSFKHYSHFSKRARDAIAGKKICIVCSTVGRPIVNLSKTRQTVRNPPVTIATVTTNHNRTRGWWRCWGRRFDKKTSNLCNMLLLRSSSPIVAKIIHIWL